MKIIKLIAVMSFFYFIAVSPVHAAFLVQAPKYVGLNSGLVGFLSFDGKDMATTIVFDRSVNANNGTLTNGPVKTIGKMGQGLRFSAENQYVSAETGNGFDGYSALTTAAWAKVETSSTFNYVLSDPVDGGNVPFGIGLDGSTPQRMRFVFQGDACGVVSATSLNDIDDRWHHYAGTWDGATAKFYEDGQLVASTACSSATILDSAKNFNVGNYDGGSLGNNGLFGAVDDVRIYDRALSSDEIKRLYKIGATLKVNTDVSRDNPDLESGLVGLWSFDGKDMATTIAFDRSGNNNNGTLTNGPTRVPGKIGQAVNFDGSDDYVDAGSGSSLDNITVKTVSAWIFPRSAGENSVGRIVDKGNNVNGWELDMCGSGNAICESSDRILYHYTTDGTTGQWIAGGSSIQYNQWQHVVVIHDNSSLTNDPVFYINGVLSATTEHQTPTGTAFASDSAQSLRMGERGDGLRTFDGLIDDVRVYNRALSSDEIKRLYKIGATLKVNTSVNTGTLKDGLVGLWSFDGKDMATTIAFDRSGNNNNGTLTNGPTRVPGKIGQGLNFDGSNDVVDMGDQATLNFTTGDFSISAWIKADSTQANESRIVSKMGANCGSATGYMLKLETNITWALQLCLNDGLTADQYSLSQDLRDNAWHHVAAVVQRGVGTFLYQDGVGTSFGASSKNVTTGANFNIGGRSAAANDIFTGSIDEARVYNRALSSDEIKRLYNLGK